MLFTRMNFATIKAKFFNNRTLLISLIWLIATALNITKAFHIDDTFHIEAAQWIQDHPFEPMSGHINWDQRSEPIHGFNQPPLYFYLLAIVGSIWGYSEIPLHLFQSVFVFFGLLYFHKLLSCYNKGFAGVGTVFLGLGPAFLVNQNLMVDIPILSLSIIFIYLLVKDGEYPKTKDLFLSAFVLSLGLLTKYSLFPLIVVLLFVLWKKKRFKYVTVLLVPLSILLAWSAFNHLEFGNAHILGRPRNPLSLKNYFFNSTSFLIALGSISPFALLFYNGFVKSRSWKTIAKVGIFTSTFVLCIYLIIFGFNVRSYPYEFFWIMFLSNGLLYVIIFFIIARNLLKIYKYQVVVIWAFCQALFIVLFAPFMATRHVLLILPPLIILGGFLYEAASSKFCKYSIIATCFLGLTLGISDWIYADFYRTSAQQALLLVPNHKKAWSLGHWGWQWYSKKAGMNFYEYNSSSVAKGDYIIMPSVISKQHYEKQSNLKREASITYSPSALNFFTTANFASFYATSHVQLPWYISNSATDTVIVYSVSETDQ